MALEFKDYYQTLGVSRGASDEEVRTAFRRLARLCHPDKTGNDSRAENRFKEINEAYEVLGDSAKRQRYDYFAGAWEAGGPNLETWRNIIRPDDGNGFSRASGASHFRFDGAGFSEFFNALFGRSREGGNGPASRRSFGSTTAAEANAGDEDRGDDLESDIWVKLEEVAQGALRPITMKRPARCPGCEGKGEHHGRNCAKCDGSGSVLLTDQYTVKIPQGIKEGALLRVPGRGEQGSSGGKPGDLYLKVHYSTHPEFRLENDVLVHELEIAPWEAVLGAVVTAPTLTGKATIRVPPGTKNGRKLRVKGKGLPTADGESGDLMLEIKIQVPDSAGARERELWEELARECSFQAREN